MNRYEGSDKWLLGLAMDLHGDNYVYVEHKNDQVTRMGNYII
jgi:hypothetical protein